MQTKPARENEPIEAGDHILTLKSVVEKQMPSYNDPSKTEPRWVWTFESERRDSRGDKQVFRYFSGSEYGNERAALTILLDQIAPKLTKAQRADLDTDVLIYQTFKARIKHEEGKAPTDPVRPKFVYIEPFKPKKRQAEIDLVEEDADDDVVESASAGGDPFAAE